MKLSFATLTLLAIGSAAWAVPLLQHAVKYDHSGVLWAWQPGRAEVSGIADWRFGGKRWPCDTVDLIPLSNYADETFGRVYGNTAAARIAPAKMRGYFKFQDPQFEHDKFTSACDRLGKFSFTKVADGKYYVTVSFSGGARTNVGLLRNVAQELAFKQVTAVNGQNVWVDLSDS